MFLTKFRILLILMSFSCIIIAYVIASLLIRPETSANNNNANLDGDEFPHSQFYEHLRSWSDILSDNSTHDSRENACQSFYDYSCGRWSQTNLHENYTQEFGSYYNEFEHSLKLFNFGLVNAIKNIKLESNGTKTYEKSVKYFFDKCRKRSQNDDDDTASFALNLFKLVERDIGPFSLFSDFSSLNSTTTLENETKISKNDIWQMAIWFQVNFQTGFLFKTGVVRVQKDCRKMQILALTPVADWSETKVDKKHLAEQLSKFPGAEKLNFSQIRDKVDEMSKLRREIRKIFDFYGRTERKIKINQLESVLPFINWKSYFEKLYPSAKNFYENLSENDAEIIVKGEKYFKNLPHILEKYEKRLLTDLAYSQIMRNVFKNLKDNVEQPRKIWQKFENHEDKCLDLVLKFFTPASIRIYFDRALKYDLNFWRSDIDSMMQTILSAFKFSLSGLDWLDRREKSLLIKKVKRIQFYSGLPDWLTDDRRLDEKTPRVEYDSHLFETGMQMERKRFLERLKPVLDRGAVFEDPDPVLETDAVYRFLTVTLSAGFALPPLYHADYPSAVKYGALGWILAHELMHAFDAAHINESASAADAATSKKNGRWLSDETLKTFHDKKHCLIKQYSKFCYKDSKTCVRGKKTINDNIADVEGLKLAFLAFKFVQSGREADENFDHSNSSLAFNFNNNVTNDKLFFLAAGRMWCGQGDDVLTHFWTADAHAPRQARVDVSMKNFPTFAKEFRCPLGSSTLAPMKICSIWGDGIEESV